MKIDFHAHILPGADHGSKDTTQSLEMLAKAEAAGVELIVATPHFYPAKDTPEAFLLRRKNCMEELRKVYPKEQGIIIRTGAEVHICAGLEHMEHLKELCIEGTNVMLLEMPFHTWSDELYDTVMELQKRGFELVLAHIERYPYKDVEELLDAGIKAQINAHLVCNMFKRGKYLKLIEKGQVWAMGSDAHYPGQQYEEYKKAFHILKEKQEQMMERMEKLLQSV